MRTVLGVVVWLVVECWHSNRKACGRSIYERLSLAYKQHRLYRGLELDV